MNVNNNRFVHVSAIKNSEIFDLIDIHKDALPRDVLPNLGSNTMKRYYNKIFALQNNNKAILLGAYSEGALIGFCCLLFERISFLSIVDLNVLRVLFFSIFDNPILLKKSILQFVHSCPVQEGSSEIAYLAVGKNNQGRGVGRFLIEKCIEFSKKQSLEYIQTKTSNNLLYNFYVRSYNAVLIKDFFVGADIYRILKFKL